MKKLLAISLLGLYVFALYRPLMPLLDYAANYTYYSEVLCVNKDFPEMECHGQCVLMQKLKAKADKENPLNKILINADEEIPEILPQCLSFRFFPKPEEISKTYLTSNPREGFFQILTPPPELG